MDSNFRAFWLAPVTWNILRYSLFCERGEKMARRFAEGSEEEIDEAFFYPSDLVNTKTTIPLRVGEERWIYPPLYPPLFTSHSGDSCILLLSIIIIINSPHNGMICWKQQHCSSTVQMVLAGRKCPCIPCCKWTPKMKVEASIYPGNSW